MFKHHYNWIAKDVGAARAGYNPDADMYVDLPSPTPPATPKHQSTPARAKDPPQSAAGEAQAAAGAVAAEASGAIPAEGEGEEETTAVDEPVAKGTSGLGKGAAGKRGGARGGKGV